MSTWSVLCCLGDLVNDIVVYADSPIATGTDTPGKIWRRPGGSAANVAVHATSLGTSTTFIGQVGDDQSGALLTTELTAVGVNLAVTSAGRTGSILVIVAHDGERSFVSDRGASMDLANLPDGCLNGVQYIHVPWYSLASGPISITARQAITQARQAGAGVSIDASSVALFNDVQTGRHAINELRPDILFANGAEVAHLNLLSEPLTQVRLTVVKQGADPAILLDHKGRIITADVIPINVEGLDTTGAGDAFAAGFLAATLAGKSDTDAATAGHQCASAHLIAQHDRYQR